VIPDVGAELLAEAEALLAQRSEKALRVFYQAEVAGANVDTCAAGRWMAQMLAGNFADAWCESDAIWRRGTLDPHRFWNGQPVDGKRVIVRCLHGLGDAVQFLRYLPRLEARAASVVVEVPPALLELAPFIDGVRHVVTWGDRAPLEPPAWDVQLEVMELPYLFRTTLDDLPIAENYLRVSSCKPSRGDLTSSAYPRVGLVWAAGEWNTARSIPFSLVQLLIENCGCEFWNLQGTPASDEWHCLSRSPRLQDAADCRTGVMNLAKTIAELDLVITVDTLAAHLAGAMGRPAWVLLGYAADWRWMTKREDSPWYPSLRLFRQPLPGDWESVIVRITEELRLWEEIRQEQQVA